MTEQLRRRDPDSIRPLNEQNEIKLSQGDAGPSPPQSPGEIKNTTLLRLKGEGGGKVIPVFLCLSSYEDP